MSRKIAKEIKIKLPSPWINDLAKEFKCTNMNVYNALSYWNNSEQAVEIRMRAKEMLIAEAQKIID